MTKEIEKKESKKNLFPFTINKDIDTWLPQDKRTSFQKSFSFLRKKLQIKQSRKTYIDSILKKCKARFFKAINDCLKQCLKIHIKKFPQSFITNISIQKNKSILGLTVQEIYKNFNLSNINLEECIKEDLCYKDKENYLKYICESKISDLYFLYIESKRYMREIQYIKHRIGIKMYLLYIFVSENFVNYYLFSKPHFCKKNNKIIENKNGKNIISICGNNLNSVEYRKSNVISLFIDESENSIEKNEIDKNIDYSNKII
jgi:hypothetical protein